MRKWIIIALILIPPCGAAAIQYRLAFTKNPGLGVTYRAYIKQSATVRMVPLTTTPDPTRTAVLNAIVDLPTGSVDVSITAFDGTTESAQSNSLNVVVQTNTPTSTLTATAINTPIPTNTSTPTATRTLVPTPILIECIRLINESLGLQ